MTLFYAQLSTGVGLGLAGLITLLAGLLGALVTHTLSQRRERSQEDEDATQDPARREDVYTPADPYIISQHTRHELPQDATDDLLQDTPTPRPPLAPRDLTDEQRDTIERYLERARQDIHLFE